MDMHLNALTASNISDKETVSNQVTVKGKKNSEVSFSSFLFGKNFLESKGENGKTDLLKMLDSKDIKSVKFAKNKNKGKDSEKEFLLDAEIMKSFDKKFFTDDSKKTVSGGGDFGNRIDGSKMKSRKSEASFVKKSDFKDMGKNSLVFKNNDFERSGFDVEKIRNKTENIKTVSEISESKVKNVQNVQNFALKKELSGLKENIAADTGLKFKELANNKTEIVVTKGKSPQSRGRVYVKNEGNFLDSKKSIDSFDASKVSTSEFRKVDNDLKMVGRTGYGLKKFSGVNALEEEEKKPLNFGTEVSLKDVKTVDNFSTQFLKDENPATARTSFENIVEQVQNGIKMHFNSQLKEMKIKLQPEELGEVEVKLKIENNIMKAEFVVESQQVKEALESKFDLLKNNLSEKGFQGSEIDVYVSTGDRGGKEAQEKFDFLANKKSQGVRNSVSKSKALNSIEKQSVRRRVTDKGNSSLDIFV